MKIRKWLKRFMCFIVVSFIVLGPYLFEAYKTNLEKVPESKEESFKGVIVIWDYPYFNKETGTRYGWITQKIKAFEKENKGVYIDFKPLSVERGLIEIETAAKMNALPDIAPVGGHIEIQQQELLEPLDDYIESSILKEYLDGVIDSVTYNNNIYGIPRLINLHIMIINRYELEMTGTSVPQKPVMPQKDFLTLTEQLYKQTGKPLLVGEKTRLSLAWLANSQEKLQEIQTKSGILYKEHLERELEKHNIPIGACTTMELAKLNYKMGGELDYKRMNLYAHQKNIYGECLAYGIFKQDDEKKLQMCLKFIDFLTNNEEQLELSKYSAFSVKKTKETLYIEDSDMGQLERLLKNANKKFTNTLTRDQKSDFINMYTPNDKP